MTSVLMRREQAQRGTVGVCAFCGLIMWGHNRHSAIYYPRRGSVGEAKCTHTLICYFQPPEVGDHAVLLLKALAALFVMALGAYQPAVVTAPFPCLALLALAWFKIFFYPFCTYLLSSFQIGTQRTHGIREGASFMGFEKWHIFLRVTLLTLFFCYLTDVPDQILLGTKIVLLKLIGSDFWCGGNPHYT